MKRLFILLTTFVTTFTLLVGCSTKSTSVIPSKPVDSAVYDPKDYLSAETEDAINKLNEQLSNGSERFQVGVYVTDSLNGYSIEEVALGTAREWQVGYSDTNNGALLVVAIEDREFRIETSDNVATKVTDSVASQILQQSEDAFRSEDYDKGVYEIVDNLGSYWEKGELRHVSSESNNVDDIFVIVLVVIFLVLMSTRSGREILFLVATSSSSSHHSSSSSSSSSSWSGGGFGGGGASGGW